MENLCKFCAGDIVQRRKNFPSAVNIIGTNHRAHIGQRPCRDFVTVRERGQIRFCVCVIVQFQCSCHDSHRFLSADRRIWGHCRVTVPVVSTHLDSHCHIVVIPFGFGYVRVLGNVSFDIAAERAVDDCRHFRAGHIAIRVNNGAGLAVKQTVIHGHADRFGIPRFCIVVLKIRSFPRRGVYRGYGNCQRQTRRYGENHCEDSFVFHLKSSL